MTIPILHESFYAKVEDVTAYSLLSKKEFIIPHVVKNCADLDSLNYKITACKESSYILGNVTNPSNPDFTPFEIECFIEKMTQDPKKPWTKITLDVILSSSAPVPPRIPVIAITISGIIAALEAEQVFASSEDTSSISSDENKVTESKSDQTVNQSYLKSKDTESVNHNLDKNKLNEVIKNNARHIILTGFLFGMLLPLSLADANAPAYTELSYSKQLLLNSISETNIVNHNPNMEFTEDDGKSTSSNHNDIQVNNVAYTGILTTMSTPLLTSPTSDTDPDPNSKTGGKDPLVFGQWNYDENADAKCESKHKFDYDNDGFMENFCYEIVGPIFVIDWNNNGNIDNGSEMLNFDRTQYDRYSPTAFLEGYPDTCDYYNCYLWQDTNPKNWKVDENELIPFSFDIKWSTSVSEGKKLEENGRYIYCHGMTTNGDEFYCVKPTYWQKGILPSK